MKQQQMNKTINCVLPFSFRNLKKEENEEEEEEELKVYSHYTIKQLSQSDLFKNLHKTHHHGHCNNMDAMDSSVHSADFQMVRWCEFGKNPLNLCEKEKWGMEYERREIERMEERAHCAVLKR